MLLPSDVDGAVGGATLLRRWDRQQAAYDEATAAVRAAERGLAAQQVVVAKIDPPAVPVQCDLL